MIDTFWESLRQSFMQLRMDCAIDPPLTPAGRLTAIWTAETEPCWRLNYHNGKDGNGVIERFTWAVESAAAQLGFTGDPSAAIPFWLDRIKQDAPAAYLQTIKMRSGETEEVYSVEILDICGLSADYCRKCQADEIRSRLPVVVKVAVDSFLDDAFHFEAAAPVGQEDRLDDTLLPDLPLDAAARIAEVLEEAHSHASGHADEARVTQAMVLYFDSMAWEYLVTQPNAAFETLAAKIRSKAHNQFAGDGAVLQQRQSYWVNEALERAANGIVGRSIPIRIAASQTQIFQDLEAQFRNMPGARGDLRVVFFDEVRFNIFSDYPDPTDDMVERQKFELLARQAMAALDFRFVDFSRAVFYWLQFLKQKSPHFKKWKCLSLCAASAEFCAELMTRARESEPRATGETGKIGGLPQAISPGSVPSQQHFGGSPPRKIFALPVMSDRRIGNPILHLDLFFRYAGTRLSLAQMGRHRRSAMNFATK